MMPWKWQTIHVFLRSAHEISVELWIQNNTFYFSWSDSLSDGNTIVTILLLLTQRVSCHWEFRIWQPHKMLPNVLSLPKLKFYLYMTLSGDKYSVSMEQGNVEEIGIIYCWSWCCILSAVIDDPKLWRPEKNVDLFLSPKLIHFKIFRKCFL